MEQHTLVEETIVFLKKKKKEREIKQKQNKNIQVRKSNLTDSLSFSLSDTIISCIPIVPQYG